MARSSGTSFQQAAAILGHDTVTATGASAARADYRVWDLVEVPA